MKKVRFPRFWPTIERPARVGSASMPFMAALVFACLGCGIAAADAGSGEEASADPDIEQLVLEVERMREQLEEMEALRQRLSELEQALADVQRAGSVGQADTSADKRDISGANASSEDRSEATSAEDESDGVAFNGAVRFTGFWSDSDEAVQGTRGDSGLDIFRVGASGSIDDFMVSAEYRFYPFMDVIHHGWIGYEFDNEDQVQVGITRVPFGLLPYAAHSFWFGVPYYMGFSDDYDLGVKYIREDGPLDLQFAFFKNAEVASESDLGRYSFDVVSVGALRNEETNQFNLRAAYTFGMNTGCSHEVGVSGQWGELYNFDTQRRGDHWAAAGHLDTRCGRWNLQLEAARYDYDPAQPSAVGNHRIRLGGFESSYDLATEGTFAVANVAYNVPVDWAAIDQLICYNDYSVLFKDRSDFRKSQLNTTGCLIGRGPIFLYLDLIQANNMVYFGDGSLAGDGESGWQTRFNVNIGYYW